MVEISLASPEEREEVALFMQEVFPRAKWSLDRWRLMLSGRWSNPEDPYAVAARDKGKLVGILGLVTARRPTTEGIGVTANMSSWYVQQPYRGQGLGNRMIGLAMADPEVTVTNFASSRGAAGVVANAGMAPLDHERLIWRPGAPSAEKFPVHTDPLALGDVLSDRDRQVVLDHVGLNLSPIAVETPDGLCVLVMCIKQKHDEYVTHEAFYVGDRALFARYSRAIADSILPPERAILSVDRRLVPDNAEPDEAVKLAIPRFFTPGRLAPEHVDLLYSEHVLLDIKIH